MDCSKCVLSNLHATVRKGGPATYGYALVRRAPFRNWLAHRVVVHVLIQRFNPFAWCAIPPGFQVHHVNHNRGDWRPGNLILMDEPLHCGIKPEVPRDPYTGRYLPAGNPVTAEDLQYLKEIAS